MTLFPQFFLPETRDSPLLHTLKEGEEFGAGDTAFASICGGGLTPPADKRFVLAGSIDTIQLESYKSRNPSDTISFGGK